MGVYFMTESVGDRLRRLRQAMRYSQRSLGDKIGVSGPAISQWENDQTFPEEKYWVGIGRELHCDFINDILKGERVDPLPLVEQESAADANIEFAGFSRTGMVPVISWVSAGNWEEGDIVTNSNIEEWIPAVPGMPSDTIAFKVKGLSMAPDYMPDSYIHVRRGLSLSDLEAGDAVVVRCNGEATFKIFQQDGSVSYLEPLNPDGPWPRYLKLDADCELIGRVEWNTKQAKRHKGKVTMRHS